MKQRRTHSEQTFQRIGEPASVRFVVTFSRTLESILGALVRRFGELMESGSRPAPQPVRVRINRTYPKYRR